jgi:hypothetical protein
MCCWSWEKFQDETRLHDYKDSMGGFHLVRSGHRAEMRMLAVTMLREDKRALNLPFE